jgi:hypothetical protein
MNWDANGIVTKSAMLVRRAIVVMDYDGGIAAVDGNTGTLPSLTTSGEKLKLYESDS